MEIDGLEFHCANPRCMEREDLRLDVTKGEPVPGVPGRTIPNVTGDCLTCGYRGAMGRHI